MADLNQKGNIPETESGSKDNQISEEELAMRLAQLVGSAPTPEEKQNVHSFLTKVVTNKDTTRLGYLTDEEIGLPQLPLRSCKELSLFCDKIAGMSEWAEFFTDKGEILTSTSLSRNAKLLNLAVEQKREVKDTTKPLTINKGWFKKKDDSNKTLD